MGYFIVSYTAINLIFLHTTSIDLATGIIAFFNDFIGVPGEVNLKLLALQNLSQIITDLLENPPPTDTSNIPNIDIIDAIPVANSGAGSSVGNVNLKTFDGLEYSLHIGGKFTLIEVKFP